MDKPPILLCYRQDLRVSDHRALSAALDSGHPVIPVYVLDDETPGDWRPGGASRWWLHHSLADLQQSLEGLGSRLVLRRGPVTKVLTALVEETRPAGVYMTRGYEPWARSVEQEIVSLCDKAGIAAKRFAGDLLFEPEAIRNKAGDPFRVFTPFYKACLTSMPPKPPLPTPTRLAGPASWPTGEALEDWDLLPTTPDWAAAFDVHWRPGEAGAKARLKAFLLETMVDYSEQRDRPDKAGTSRLSPYLHAGSISPHQCWHAVEERLATTGDGRDSQGGQSFLRELVWREFSYHLLYHWPDLPEKAFRQEFEAFPWVDDHESLKAWQQGRTGYPIVDAGMRELWQTGWMHNRVRMITASFLIKDLLISWQEGERWFWDTLVDADLASNAASWQWVAGSGADAAPYFRIFNPVLQGRKFDPDGTYVRRYLPEIAKLGPNHVHAPWTAPAAALEAAGVVLGETYPLPIVDHSLARTAALNAYQSLKKG